MPFLHALIYSKIEHSNVAREKNRLSSASKDSGKGGGVELTEGRGEQVDFAEQLEGISHSVEMDNTNLDSQRLKQVSNLVLTTGPLVDYSDPPL